MLKVTDLYKKEHVIDDTKLHLVLSWRGVDTFFCIGQAEAVLIESGMEFPAKVSFMRNGFVRASMRLDGKPFNLYFKSATALLGKFSAYVVDSNDEMVGKALLIEHVHG